MCLFGCVCILRYFVWLFVRHSPVPEKGNNFKLLSLFCDCRWNVVVDVVVIVVDNDDDGSGDGGMVIAVIACSCLEHVCKSGEGAI